MQPTGPGFLRPLAEPRKAAHMKTKLLLALIVILGFTYGFAHAQTGGSTVFIDGNKLYEWSRAESNRPSSRREDFNDGMFYGYVAGVFDADYPRAKQGELAYCAPRGVTIAQVADIVRKYLADNPQLRHHGANNLISGALNLAWPCSNKPESK
jgi:hypothetical protein